jgi:hypothetical protein
MRGTDDHSTCCIDFSLREAITVQDFVKDWGRWREA